MSWPLSQDYNEAIQSPRTSFSDAELKTGEAVANALGIPMPRSGNFADVYEVRCPGGARWAVKCFTREVHGLRERYQEISSYLRQANLPFAVDFQYLEQGIRVRGRWYPVLKMQWVEGYVLNEFVRDNLDKKPVLQAMSQIWLRMARRLRVANIAHGDLQHGNVMLVPGSKTTSLAVKLIDYDGMCVPSLVGRKSGEVGHPAYQHPERLRTAGYGPEVDRFSLLVIAAALRCLPLGGRSLWERYDTGDNLLFRQQDFEAPAQSPLFRELLALRDPQAQLLVRELYRACQGPLDKAPLVTDLLPDEPPASARVTAAPAAAKAVGAATAQGPDWDFGEDAADGAIVKKRASARKIPLGIWGALAGAAAVLLLGVGVAVGLVLHKGQAEKTDAAVTPNKPEAAIPNPKAKPPALSSDAGNTGSEAEQPGSGRPAARVRTVYLADLREAKVTALSFAKKDGSKVKNVTSPNALSLHPPDNGAAQVAFNLGKKYDRFKAAVAIRDGTNGGRGSGTPLTFRVLGDGKELWHSAPIQQCGRTQDCAVPVAGVERLELQVNCPGTAYCAHAVWVEPRLEEDNPPTNPVQVADTPGDFPPPKRIFQLSPAGDMLAISDEGDKVWRLVEPRTKNVIREFRGHEGAVSAAAFSADGTRIVTGAGGYDKQMIVWDVKTGRPVRMTQLPGDPLRSVALSADGKRVVGTGGTTSVIVWEVEGMGGYRYNHPSKVLSVAFSPDGKNLLCGLEKSDKPDADAMLAWSLAPNPSSRGFRTPDGPVIGVAASPDGNYFATAHSGQKPMVSLWEAQTAKLLWKAPAPAGPVHQLAFSPDGRFLLAAAGNRFQVWRVGPRRRTALGGGDVNQEQVSAAFTPDSRNLTFAYRKGDLSFVQTVGLPGAAVVVKPPPRPRPRPGRFSNKVPVPDEPTLDEKRKLLRVMYRDDYRAMSDKSLASKLYDDSRRQGDLSLVYAMLSESRDRAVRAGDVDGALRAASALGARFAVDPLESKCQALEQVLPVLSAKDKHRLLTEKTLLLLERAVIDENFDCGERLLKVARAAAPKADISAVLGKMVERAARQFEAGRKEYEAVQSAARKLQTEPDDPEANLALGQFRCFVRGDWDAGLPLLIKGGDSALSELARKDAADPADATAQAAVGDAWWDRAAKSAGKEKAACQRRAFFWYRECVADLDRKEQGRVKDRLRKLTALLPELGRPYHDLDTGGAMRKGGVLHLSRWQRIATRQLYRGPIDIRATVLLPPQGHLRITFLNGGEMSLDPEGTSSKLRVYSPFGPDPDERGNLANTTFARLAPGPLQEIRIQVTRNGWTVWVNDRVAGGQGGNNLGAVPYAASPVRVWSDNGEVEVKSLVVKRVR